MGYRRGVCVTYLTAAWDGDTPCEVLGIDISRSRIAASCGETKQRASFISVLHPPNTTRLIVVSYKGRNTAERGMAGCILLHS